MGRSAWPDYHLVLLLFLVLGLSLALEAGLSAELVPLFFSASLFFCGVFLGVFFQVLNVVEAEMTKLH